LLPNLIFSFSFDAGGLQDVMAEEQRRRQASLSKEAPSGTTIAAPQTGGVSGFTLGDYVTVADRPQPNTSAWKLPNADASSPVGVSLPQHRLSPMLFYATNVDQPFYIVFVISKVFGMRFGCGLFDFYLDQACTDIQSFAPWPHAAVSNRGCGHAVQAVVNTTLLEQQRRVAAQMKAEFAAQQQKGVTSSKAVTAPTADDHMFWDYGPSAAQPPQSRKSQVGSRSRSPPFL
jgi:hypothetical protein